LEPNEDKSIASKMYNIPRQFSCRKYLHWWD